MDTWTPKFDVIRFVSDARELAKRRVPFRDQGSNPETGLDCIHVCKYLYELQGTLLPEELAKEFRAYHPTTDGKRMMEIMCQWLIPLPDPADAQPGDLLLFRGKQATRHVAIKVQDDPIHVVEAYLDDGAGKLLDWPLDPIRSRLIVAAFRIPDFAA